MLSVTLGLWSTNGENMSNLLVPPGTAMAELKSVSIQAVDNGVVLTKVFLIQETTRAPYQTQSTLIYPSMKEALETVLKEI